MEKSKRVKPQSRIYQSEIMPMSFKEIRAWRDKEEERLASITDEYEHEWCEKTVIILSAILQDD